MGNQYPTSAYNAAHLMCPTHNNACLPHLIMSDQASVQDVTVDGRANYKMFNTSRGCSHADWMFVHTCLFNRASQKPTWPPQTRQSRHRGGWGCVPNDDHLRKIQATIRLPGTDKAIQTSQALLMLDLLVALSREQPQASNAIRSTFCVCNILHSWNLVFAIWKHGF